MPDQEIYNVNVDEDLLTSDKVAEILEVSKKVISREIREGRLKAFKRLKKWYIFRSDLYAYIREGGSADSFEEDEDDDI